MTMKISSRRELLKLAAVGSAAAAAVTISTAGAEAYQGNMERALASLYSALGSLREATPDKGGHKANAIRFIQQAINETQAGIEFAAEKFGD